MSDKPTGGLSPYGGHSLWNTAYLDPYVLVKEELRAELSKLPSVEALKNLYTSQEDQERVIRRLFLKTVHDLVFKRVLNAPDRVVISDGIRRPTENGPLTESESDERLSTLAAAFRDFAHDAQRLDGGIKAELVLTPVSAEPEQRESSLISSVRKLVLNCLVYIETRDRKKQTELMACECAAEWVGLKPNSLRTYIRDMRVCENVYKKHQKSSDLEFSEAEYLFYSDLRRQMESLVGKSDRSMIATLLAPILRGLGGQHKKVKAPRRRKIQKKSAPKNR